jgi:hypothetical protein
MIAVEKFVACARAQVGKPYKWATAGPNTFDCSGLVAFCYHDATGETISRSSYDQVTLGLPVHVDEIRPGDLVFWGRADHVGIYEGRGQVINALNETRGVVRTLLDDNYGIPFLGVRRIFTEGVPLAGEPTGKPSHVAGPDSGNSGSNPLPSTNKPRKEQRKREKDRQRR